MSGGTTTSWIEKFERLMEMKPPAMVRSQHWLYRTISVCFVVAIFFAFLSAIFADTPALALLWLAQMLLNTILFGVYFGQGLYEGSFGRSGSGVRQAGRKLQSISIIALLAIFPFYCAFAAGSLTNIGAWVRGVAGLALVLLFVLFVTCRCLQNRRRYP